MLAKVQSAGILGVEAYGVCAEVDVTGGLPGYHLVGLGASEVKEGSVRVRSALSNCGYPMPPRKVIVNLAPADVHKDGAAFDLPIAIGLLAATGVVPPRALEETFFLGELSLDGQLRRVAGGLPVACLARKRGIRALILPRESAKEAALLGDVPVFAAQSLPEVAAHLKGETQLERVTKSDAAADGEVLPDLSEVRGLEHAKLALEIAAAGGHNLLFVGPPGCGKSMLARRLPSILPPLDEREALETSIVHSASGRFDRTELPAQRPFRAPNHDVSMAGMLGGGALPKPGEISLAHNGVLFLDELPEFKRPVLDSLREPLEDRAVTLVRLRTRIRFPASFSLIAAMNPCPCGFHGSGIRNCVCSFAAIQRYRGKISGPLLDRIDIQVHVPHVRFEELSQDRIGVSSSVVAARVLEARDRQRHRLAKTKLHCNAQLGAREVARFCQIDEKTTARFGQIADRRGLSARSVHRVLKLARSIADLAGREKLALGDVMMAVDLRVFDQEVR